MKYSSEIEWLKIKADYLTISKIESDLSIPQGTLNKFIKGKRELPANWHEAVTGWVKKFKK